MHEVIAGFRYAYSSSAAGHKSCMICLESIKHARVIIDSEMTIKEILLIAGIPLSYRKVVSVGLNLSKYVDIKR